MKKQEMTNTTSEKCWLNVEQAAEFLNYKKSYLYKLVFYKKIPCYKYGPRQLMFDKNDLQAWMAGRMQFVPSQEQMETAAANHYAGTFA